MKRLPKIILIILTLVFIGCENKFTKEESEQDIFDSIFVAIVDSTYKDQRLYTFFTQLGKPIYDKNGEFTGLDSVGQYQRDLEYEAERKILQKDTINLIIAVENEGLINEKTDLSKYRSSKFIFKHLSEHPISKDSEYTDWKTQNKFAGAMSFSRIKFDAEKTSGSLNVTYSCGGKCGLGYLVYLKKVKNKWTIFNVKTIWIS